ncbi:hypothetical protein [Neobacillus drentensis]|uniref:hypothetical protein n=1 Tax=Neobacillus drentensis TaxID=220684 RepID=UPI0030000BB6
MEQQKLVRFYVKKPDPLIKYSYSAPFVVKDEVIGNNQINFHIPTLIEEVKQLPKKKIKEYKRTIQAFLTTASSFLVLPLKSMAAPLQNMPASTLPNHAEGIPPEILELLLKLLVISVGSAVIFAAILLVAAGVKRMLGNRKESSEWTVDILKGLVQVMVAVPVVFLIYYVVSLLFKGSGWFISPF